MKEWFSASEMAKLLGISKRGCINRANRENWQSRARQGRGGGLEYHISALPLETQRELLIKHSPIKIPNPNDGMGQTELSQLDGDGQHLPGPVVTAGRDLQPYQPQTAGQLADWQRKILLARHRILRAVDRYAATLGREQAIRILCEQAEQRNLPDGLNDVLQPPALARRTDATGSLRHLTTR